MGLKSRAESEYVVVVYVCTDYGLCLEHEGVFEALDSRLFADAHHAGGEGHQARVPVGLVVAVHRGVGLVVG